MANINIYLIIFFIGVLFLLTNNQVTCYEPYPRYHNGLCDEYESCIRKGYTCKCPPGTYCHQQTDSFFGTRSWCKQRFGK
uniref:CSON014672 protein n=1 Tax=Culicoides sonorensis TaxID=179676 RepID=A0A336KQZ1_CULSO